MKNNFEKIKQDIEFIYLPLEKQLEKAGCIVGNSFFDEEQLKKLKRFKPNREKIWKEIEKNFNLEQCFKIAGIIHEGFIYMADNGSIRELSRTYQDRKKKIINYVKKQNEQLINDDPYFQNYPLQIEIAPHHLDSPTKRGRPAEMKNVFTEQLSLELKSHFQGKDQRADFISRVLRYFFAVPKDQAKRRNIRQHF